MIHIKKFRKGFRYGYTKICELGKRRKYELEFGIRVLPKGAKYSNDFEGEKCFLLLEGEIRASINGKKYGLKRKSLFDENPTTFSLSKDYYLLIEAEEKTELVEIQTRNNKNFEPIIVLPKEVKSESRGEKRLLDQRFVKTCWDYFSHPESNLVIGEVVTFPGNSSSYPPHGHPQPEIYFYRLLPSQGYGLAKLGEDAYVIRSNDTVKILNGLDHPQYAAPGYGLWYLWLVRHLPGVPYTGFKYVSEHKWMLTKDAEIWKPKRK